MAYKSDILLGRITKVSGFEGAVSVKLEKIFIENIPIMESVFLEIEGRPVPFFISDSEYSGADVLKLKFKDYITVDKISEFVGCRVLLTTPPVENQRSEDIQELTGYKVLIKSKVYLGIVAEVIPNPGQWILSILSDENREILIPFHKDFTVSIDRITKTLIMDLPEGLTEIN
jgi:16S rRNA processing protein RimM